MQSDGTAGDSTGNIPWLTLANNAPLVAGTSEQLPSPSNPGLTNSQCILHGSESSLQKNADNSIDATVTVTFRTPNWSPAFNTQTCGYNANDLLACLAGAPQNWGYDKQRWIWLVA